MKNLNTNGKNNFILLSPPHKQIKSFFERNTMVLPHKKNFFEFSSSDLSGELGQKKINKNKKAIKRHLFLKKIDLKDLTNKNYLEGVHKIFNDENIFLNKYYKGNEVVVGKSQNKSETNLSYKNVLGKKIFSKKQNLLYKKERTLSSTTNLSYKTESLKLNSKIKKYYNKKDTNIISDDDLKKIYQKWINREQKNEENKNKNKKNLKFSKIVHFTKKEFDGILNLQNLILDRRNERNIEISKMEERLLRHTTKNRDKLLINQINNYRIKKEEIDELDNQNNENELNNKTTINNFNKTGINKIKDLDVNLQWQTCLRDYQNDIMKKNKPSNLLKKRCNSSNTLNLKNRYISFHSFEKRDVKYNLKGNLNPLYAQITPSNYIKKEKSEKIRDSFNEINLFSRNFKRNRERNQLEKKVFYNTNIFDGLNIRGKKLINFEIELSKELEGKRKRLVKFPHLDNEIKSKIFAESSNIIIGNKVDIPTTVKNTVELHYD